MYRDKLQAIARRTKDRCQCYGEQHMSDVGRRRWVVLPAVVEHGVERDVGFAVA